MLQEKLLGFALMGVEWVLWVLVMLSVLCVAIAVERLIYVTLNKTPRTKLHDAVTKFLAGGTSSAFIEELKPLRGIEAQVLVAGVNAAIANGSDSAEEVIAGHLKFSRSKLNRGLIAIGTTGSNAPFVGLFGTVLGIIQAFHDLAGDVDNAQDAVMSGISEALVATAVGLLVAIPAVVLYNYFQRRNKTTISDLESLAHLVLSRIKAQPKTVEER